MRNGWMVLVMLVAASGQRLLADSVTYSVTPNGSGAFEYNFSLSNTGSTVGTLFDLFLAIPADISNIDTLSIGTPIGWGDPTGGLLFFGPDVSPSTSFIEWAADFSGAYDIGTGSSLSGFSFVSNRQVDGPITFALNGATTFDTAITAVPEPATFGMCILFTGVLLLLRQVPTPAHRQEKISDCS